MDESEAAAIGAALQAFAEVAPGYDRASLRFLAFAADRLVDRARPAPGGKVLDVGCGTGNVAFSAAVALRGMGRVTAIDLVEPMLERTAEGAARRGLTNVDLHPMDGGALEFRAGYFHRVLCNAGLVYLPDPQAALRGWARALRPGGVLGLTTFGAAAFEPMLGDLLHRTGARDLWRRLPDPVGLEAMLASAGLSGVTVEAVQLGFHLANGLEWWDLVWNSDLRATLEGLDPAARGRLQADAVAAVDASAGPDGLWMDVTTLFAQGTKPAG